MQAIEYNLLDEPWICVIGTDCRSTRVSLTDALLRAHEFADLGGELPTQDVAILRLLLAVLHTVFSRANERGDDSPIETVDDALDRWDALWQLGRFPEKPLRDYLSAWRERFWLFHPERPFYQVNAAEIGTAYSAAKLDGELSESSNKVKLFPVKTGAEKARLDYGEAARWLIYQNAFDDNSSKPKGKNLPAPGIGWLGKLGLILAVGNNLFETLMLNLVLLDDRQLWPEANRPVWELPDPRAQERTEIAIPGNQAALLTLQSRRLLLRREGGQVTGYSLLGGDFFPKEGSFAETMTLWSRREDKKSGKPPVIQPKRHDPSRLIWQEFGAMLGQEARRPGIAVWLKRLQDDGILPKTQILRLRIASVQYGSSDYFATDVYADELTLHANLLSELGRVWQGVITNEVNLCKDCADRVGWLAAMLDKAAGDRGGGQEGPARERCYAAIDVPFRAWLAKLDAQAAQEDRDSAVQAWHAQARGIALRLGRTMVSESGDAAFVGRALTEERNDKKIKNHYSAPEAWLAFQRSIYKLYLAN